MIGFNKLIQAQFNKMCESGKLFRSSLTGQQVWDLYLKSFPKEHNPIFRDPNSSTHNCNHCNNFIRRYGNIVAIDDDFNVVTMFDVEADEEYSAVAKVLDSKLKNATISEVFFETFNELNYLPYEKCSKNNERFQLGVDKNVKQYTKEEAEKYGVVKPEEIRTFNHLHLYLPKIFVDMSDDSIYSIIAKYKDAKNVFQRAMVEIPLDILNLVKDLINQGSLLDGQTHLYKLHQIIPLKEQYDKLSENKKDNWCWVNSYKLPFAKFKNELIGVLCTELAEGEELNKACQLWNKRVDPANYMKAVAPITKKQIEEAKKFVEENGYAESFVRRFATIDDIKVSEIKHINVGDGKLKTVSIFDNVKSTSTRHKRSEFDNVEEVSIEKFMTDILPSCTSVEAFLTNKHDGNMVSLTTADNKESRPIFKWSNNYSWTFNGNLAGKSMIKDAVEAKGGKVDGVLRFSIMWAENDPTDNSDLDAHAQEPNGTHIYYSTEYRKDRGGNIRTSMSGQLDIDITQPSRYSHKNIVENIAWSDSRKMKDGVYKLWINQYANRGSKGFRAEIEFGGDIFSYEYNKPVIGNVQIAEVTLKNGEFTIKHFLPESSSSKELYGLQTNEFHKVNLVCLTPNHWGENNVGNKHYLFMLDGCKSPVGIRSFHNENLIPELAQHRKVLEVLGNTTMNEPTEKQLSGLGFNATVRDELVVKLQGSHKRIIRIKI
jgi:hypothetical protein